MQSWWRVLRFHVEIRSCRLGYGGSIVLLFHSSCRMSMNRVGFEKRVESLATLGGNLGGKWETRFGVREFSGLK